MASADQSGLERDSMLAEWQLRPAAFFWTWVLPITVLTWLNYLGYRLIEGDMSPEQHQLARWLGVGSLANLGAGLLVWSAVKRGGSLAARHWVWGLPAIAMQVTWLILTCTLSDSVLPGSVTTWIYPEMRFIGHQFMFAMVPLMDGVLRLAGCTRMLLLERSLKRTFLGALLVPVALYLSVVIFEHGHRIGEMAFVASLIVLGLTVLVLVVRVVLQLLRRRAPVGSDNLKWVVLAMALLMPLGGLILNRGIPYPADFQCWEVYALTVINAASLGFAVLRGTAQPRLSLVLLMLTLPFSLYFFLVFLPFTPVSLLALLAFGLGLLALTPLMLGMLHLHLLYTGWRTVEAVEPRNKIRWAAIAAVLVLPGIFVGRAWSDRVALHSAIDYVYAPAIERGAGTFRGSVSGIRHALAHLRARENEEALPLLDDFYDWVVFDNLMLPEARMVALERAFFGEAGEQDAMLEQERWRRRERNRRVSNFSGPVEPSPVRLERLMSRVSENPLHGLTLALTLHNDGDRAAEYVAPIQLPPGVFVTGFRLQVGQALVPGRIFEKKTALWVYSKIRRVRRDPGVLFYRTPNELQLRVFPVGPGETTQVEIDFLLPAAVRAEVPAETAGDLSGLLAAAAQSLPPRVMIGPQGEAVVAGLRPSKLAGVTRESYLHVIVDRSADNAFTGDLPAAIRRVAAEYPQAKRVRVTLANYDTVEQTPELTPIEEVRALRSETLRPTGDLLLDTVVAREIRRHRDLDLDRTRLEGELPPRPIFVVLAAHLPKRGTDFTLTNQWVDLLDELDLIERDEDGGKAAYAWSDGAPAPLVRWGNSVRPVRADRAVRFAQATSGAVLQAWSSDLQAWQTVQGLGEPALDSSWARAVRLQERQQDQARSPGDSVEDMADIVRASRESGLLLGASSYIVVESEAQWRMLEQSEKQKLRQNDVLEFREAPAPAGWMLAGGLALWLVIRARRKIRRTRVLVLQ